MIFLKQYLPYLNLNYFLVIVPDSTSGGVIEIRNRVFSFS